MPSAIERNDGPQMSTTVDRESELRYPRVLGLFSESPWAILEEKLWAIGELLALRAQGGRLSAEEIEERVGERRDPEPFLAFANDEGGIEYAEFDAAARGNRASGGGAVAVLPLMGTIFPRANLFTEFSGGTTAQGFQAMFNQAMNDPEVGSILIEVDSPGGMVAMIPETAAVVRAARGKKPVVAHANTMAASAAYHIASQADELVAAPSAFLGSIGVISFHTDITEAEAMAGIKTTAIFAGKYKAEGWPTTPLTDEALQARKAMADEVYGQMVADIARGRGVKSAAIRDGFGEGRVVSARSAVDEGMADRIDTFEATIARMARGGVASRPVGARALADAFTEGVRNGTNAVVDAAALMVAGTTNASSGTTAEPADEAATDAALVEGAERLFARPGYREHFSPTEQGVSP